jgi:2-oxoglutarate ferredoxin oxidoreductase subunit delta
MNFDSSSESFKSIKMAKARGLVEIDNEACKGCQLCTVACPNQVLGMSKDVNAKGYYHSEMVNPEACTGCTNCAQVCPDAVITVYRLKQNPSS